MQKNFLITFRNARGFVIQVLAPLFIIALLKVMEVGIQSNRRTADVFADIPNSNYTEIQSIPACIPLDGGECYTFVYAPAGDTIVEGVIADIRDRNDPPIPEDKVRGFADATEVDEFLLANPNVTQGGYIFYIQPTGPVTTIAYQIQANQTSNYRHGRAIPNGGYIVLPLQKAVDAALIRYVSGNPDCTWNVQVARFPHPELSTADDSIVGQAGPAFFLGALLFTFVITISQIVTEKELKLRESMRQMGLMEGVYWFTWFVTQLVSYSITTLVLAASGAVFQFNFFLINHPGTYILLFWLFGISLIPLGFLITAFIQRRESATTTGFIIFMLSVVLQIVASIVIGSEKVTDGQVYGLSLFSPVLLAKGLDDLNRASIKSTDVGIDFSDLMNTSERLPLGEVYYWLIIDTLIYFVLAWYFDNIMPRSYGTPNPPYFPFTPSYWTGKLKAKPLPEGQVTELAPGEDDDVHEMETAMKKGEVKEDDAIQILDLRKVYKGAGCKGKVFTAVDHLWLTIKSNSLFCLLGPNGAGKSTTISMLTGVTKPTAGDARVLGRSITSEMSSLQELMGVCPQFDILWEELTGKEHLTLFAALKGIPRNLIGEEVHTRLEEVSLMNSCDDWASSYSGGMRRRLSVAIAFIGDPRVVYLDEPTTGMDPVSRRGVWNIIEKAKKGRVIILTTHSMEEADVLGDTIAIMANGGLRCIGSALRLKNKFGAGYSVTVSAEEKKAKEIVSYFESSFKGVTLADESIAGYMSFKFPRELSEELPKFFEQIESRKAELGIHYMQLSLTTLEDVFLHIAESAKAGEAKRETTKKNCCKKEGNAADEE